MRKPETLEASQVEGQASDESTSRVLGPGKTKVLLLPSDTLDERCKVCSDNLRICVQEALRGTAIEYSHAQAALRIIQGRLDEHRLRLDIWMADCGVTDGQLSKITVAGESLSNVLGDAFARLLSEIVMIYNDVVSIQQDANKARVERNLAIERYVAKYYNLHQNLIQFAEN